MPSDFRSSPIGRCANPLGAVTGSNFKPRHDPTGRLPLTLPQVPRLEVGLEDLGVEGPAGGVSRFETPPRQRLERLHFSGFRLLHPRSIDLSAAYRESPGSTPRRHFINDNDDPSEPHEAKTNLTHPNIMPHCVRILFTRSEKGRPHVCTPN